MDPNACLQRFLDAIEDNEASEAYEAHLDLTAWLRGGGFEPSNTEGFATFKAWKRLDRFTSLGSYPLVYLHHGRCICPPCASLVGCEPFSAEVHWEGGPVECEECGGDIESAYGEPDREEITDERTAEDWNNHHE